MGMLRSGIVLSLILWKRYTPERKIRADNGGLLRGTYPIYIHYGSAPPPPSHTPMQWFMTWKMCYEPKMTAVYSAKVCAVWSLSCTSANTNQKQFCIGFENSCFPATIIYPLLNLHFEESWCIFMLAASKISELDQDCFHCSDNQSPTDRRSSTIICRPPKTSENHQTKRWLSEVGERLSMIAD